MQVTLAELRQRIKVMRPIPVDDEDFLEEEIMELWAKVVPITPRIEEKDPERADEITYKIGIRYRENLKPDDVIEWRGKRLIQVAPPYDEGSRKRWLILECQEDVADGAAENI